MNNHESIFMDEGREDIHNFNDDLTKDSKIYESAKEKCSVCKVGDVKKEREPTLIIVYGRDGVTVARHQYKRCNFRNAYRTCRTGFYYGYYVYQGMRVFEDDALKNDVLVVTTNTAFTIDYLVELAGQIDISSDTFEAAAKRYNRYHQMRIPTDVMNQRVLLNKDRVNQAYFLFVYLEISTL
jgi:hypothetical protein